MTDLEGMEHPSDQFRRRTVVFSLPPRSWVRASDFASHIALLISGWRLHAFGTVGVGHIWHLTCDSPEVAKLIVDAGNFAIGDIPVVVTLMQEVSFTVFLHWVPFWVPHVDVERALGAMLHGTYSCSYVRIKQKGFEGCYSTQRRVRSTVDVRKLPHFLTVKSEGLNYRAFVFVPGRAPVCFACGVEGHMKDKCGAKDSQGVQASVGASALVEKAKSGSDPVLTESSSAVEQVSHPVGSPEYFMAQYDQLDREIEAQFSSDRDLMSDSSEVKCCPVAVGVSPDCTRTDEEEIELIARTVHKKLVSIVTRKEIVLPKKTTMSKTQVKKSVARCTVEECLLYQRFIAGELAFQDMHTHCVSRHVNS